jgi:nickel/cobalt exporter
MDLAGMIETGAVGPVLLFVIALALGALHGLEPGHSKTMMAAYIIAVRGTPLQAAVLGISAAFSHSLIVWALAFLALYWGNELIGEALEPWFMMGSGAIVVIIAAWMFRDGLRQTARRRAHHGHSHSHHSHAHHDHTHNHGHNEDAHAQAHARQIEDRLAANDGGGASMAQTIMFGLSGGLIPCPAAITVFILCLHLGKLTLGVTLVAAFSIGLALTLVFVGVIAAVSLNYVAKQTSRFDAVMNAAPWASAVLIGAIGLMIIWSGFAHL